jgi:alkylhydroperoxidase family enzyme
MARIITPPGHHFPWFVRLFLWNQRRRYGAVLEPARLWGRSPWVFTALALLFGALDRRGSPLSPALRALLTVRVSQLNWCAFWADLPRHQESPHYDAAENAALDYAEVITRSDHQVDDKLFARLREHYDDDAIVELTGMVAFQNMSSKFNAALDVAPQGFCRLLAQDANDETERAA